MSLSPHGVKPRVFRAVFLSAFPEIACGLSFFSWKKGERTTFLEREFLVSDWISCDCFAWCISQDCVQSFFLFKKGKENNIFSQIGKGDFFLRLDFLSLLSLAV